MEIKYNSSLSNIHCTNVPTKRVLISLATSAVVHVGVQMTGRVFANVYSINNIKLKYIILRDLHCHCNVNFMGLQIKYKTI